MTNETSGTSLSIKNEEVVTKKLMPSRISPVLTDNDKRKLQTHRNRQDIVHSLILQTLTLIRKNPEFCAKSHYKGAFTAALSIAFDTAPASKTNEEEKTNEN